MVAGVFDQKEIFTMTSNYYIVRNTSMTRLKATENSHVRMFDHLIYLKMTQVCLYNDIYTRYEWVLSAHL